MNYLLLRLELHASAQFIQIGSGAGHVRFVGLVQSHLVGLFQSLGVIHFAGRRQRVQISRATCCTTSPRARVMLKCAARVAAPAAFHPAITGPENNVCL